VLNAFREVEAALDAERKEWERRQWLEGSVDAARHSLELAELRYLHGLDNLLLTIETQRRLYLAEIDLISTERQWRVARVNLILALGGHWDEPSSDDQAHWQPQNERTGGNQSGDLSATPAFATVTAEDDAEEAQGDMR
jgi:outer membrane protein TolC